MNGAPVATALEDRSSARARAVATVDHALQRPLGRGMLTRDEARLLLEEVLGEIPDTVETAVGVAAAREALAGLGEAQLVDRTRVIDALLDVRNALTR